MSHAKPSRPAPPFSAAVLASARDYVPALIEACGDDADPIAVLLETANYPRILRKIDMAEFVVGWFHGVAEAAGGDNVRETYRLLLEATASTAPAKRSAPAPAPPKAKAPAPGKRQRVAVVPPAELARPAAAPAPALPPPPASKRQVMAAIYEPPAVTPAASPRGRRQRDTNQASLAL